VQRAGAACRGLDAALAVSRLSDGRGAALDVACAGSTAVQVAEVLA
jgi:hypothetical protein